MKSKILLILIFFSVSLASCVTSKRCSRKFPPSIHTETIIRDTTIITERTKFDTIFNSSRDTVFLFDQQTQIKIKYFQLPGDSVFVSAECPPDTVTIQKTVINNEYTTSDKKSFNWNLFLWACIIGIILFGAGYLIKTIKSTF